VSGPGRPRLILVACTAAALICFAANSLLCRLALAGGAIDAAAFTGARIGSGALVLALLAGPRRALGHGTWRGAALLFGYAAAFSLAYRKLPAATGALLLFAAVQLTMVAAGLLAGERPPAREWAGWALAIAGLLALVSPGLRAPDPWAAALMAAAGAAWGGYSLLGRRSREALATTAGSFARAAPLAALFVLASGRPHASALGLALACVSGVVASGLGYALWYRALRSLSASRAALLQLAAPVLAAAAAIPILGEPVTMRLAVSGAAILGGIALAVARRTPPAA
jgi:drug/metabolite transporter (DMT)-like permease